MHRSELKVHLQQRFEPFRSLARNARSSSMSSVTVVSVPSVIFSMQLPWCSPLVSDSVACPTRTARSLIVIRQSLAVRLVGERSGAACGAVQTRQPIASCGVGVSTHHSWVPLHPPVPQTHRRMLRHNAIDAWKQMQKTGWQVFCTSALINV